MYEVKQDLKREKDRLLNEMVILYALNPQFDNEKLALQYSQNQMRVEEINRSLEMIEHGPDLHGDLWE